MWKNKNSISSINAEYEILISVTSIGIDLVPRNRSRTPNWCWILCGIFVLSKTLKTNRSFIGANFLHRVVFFETFPGSLLFSHPLVAESQCCATFVPPLSYVHEECGASDTEIYIVLMPLFLASKAG